MTIWGMVLAVFRPNGETEEMAAEAEAAVDQVFDRVEARIDHRVDRLRQRYGIGTEPEPVAAIEAESKPKTPRKRARKAGA